MPNTASDLRVRLEVIQSFRCMIQNRSDGSKFTSSKREINAMENIKLFSMKVFISMLIFSLLEILVFYKGKPLRMFDQFRELLKETKSKNWVFYSEKDGRNNTKNG